MKIVTREEAKARSAKKYFTGIPCSKGHIAQRYEKTRDCLECCNERRKRHKRVRTKDEPIVRAVTIPGARFVAGRCQSGSA